MKVSYWHKGETLDYKNNTVSKIEAGTVVNLTTRIGVAGTDINPSETGSLHVIGVFKMSKAATEEIKTGANVYYDTTNECITATATSNIPAGYATLDAAANDSYVYVKLLG